jgi:putative oxidoreductase
MTKHYSKNEHSVFILRGIVGLIIFMHGAHRLIDGGSMPFGGWLESQGIPFGSAVAWFITFFEIIGAPFLILGKKVAHICLVYIAIYTAGLFMVHLQHGWFVVGSGSNGIEFSLLLIASLVSIAYPYSDDLKWRLNTETTKNEGN